MLRFMDGRMLCFMDRSRFMDGYRFMDKGGFMDSYGFMDKGGFMDGSRFSYSGMTGGVRGCQ